MSNPYLCSRIGDIDEGGIVIKSASVPMGKIQKLYITLGEKLGEALHKKMMSGTLLTRKFSWLKVLAFSMAILVFLFSLTFAALGLYLIFHNLYNIISDMFGIIFVSLAIFTFPRIKSYKEEFLSKDEFPTLYNLVNRIAKEMNAKPISRIAINSEFNAAFTQQVYKRKSTLFIGYPLFYILDKEEKVALIAHELAHGINQDSTTGYIIGSAYHFLIEFYNTIKPRKIFDNQYTYMFLVNIILYLFSFIVYSFSYLLIHLLWREKQIAEYKADYLSARVSGVEAVLRLLDKLYLGYIYESSIQRVTIRSEKVSLFELLKSEISKVNLDIVNEMKMKEKEKGSRLNYTHPPTMYRAEFIKQQDIKFPKVKISEKECNNLEKELHIFKDKIQQELILKYRDSLY